MDRRHLSARALNLNLRWLILLIALIGLMGCMTAPLPTPTPRATPKTTPTARITPTPTAIASPTPVRTPTATPSPVSTPTPTANIVIYTPAPKDKIGSPVHISGVARVFEAQFNFDIKDAQGKILAQGPIFASEGAPAWGTFAVDISFQPPTTEQPGTVEVFDRSPKDGSVIDLVIVPVILLPK